MKVVSVTARIFDPLGLVRPVIIIAQENSYSSVSGCSCSGLQALRVCQNCGMVDIETGAMFMFEMLKEAYYMSDDGGECRYDFFCSIQVPNRILSDLSFT